MKLPFTLIHPEDRPLWRSVERLARAVAKTHALLLREIEPKRRPLSDGAAGLCYCQENRITIRLRCKDRVEDGGRWWSEPDPWDQIVLTVAHELAHLRHPDHSPEFKALERTLHQTAQELLGSSYHSPE